MQAARPALPELHTLRQQAITTPVRQTMGRRVEKALLGFRQQTLKFGAIANHLALRRCPGTEPATQGADLKISIRLLLSNLLHPPLDTNLTLECRPEESHGCIRRSIQLLTLSAVVIGEKGKRSEEHTSELQSLMRISYAVFCLK